MILKNINNRISLIPTTLPVVQRMPQKRSAQGKGIKIL